MKKLIFSGFLILSSGLIFSQKLQVSYSFKGIEVGYDHTAHCVLYVDGKETATSDDNLQSKGGSFSAKVPKGEHVIRVVAFAKFEGKWEAHTIENGYSQDCAFDGIFIFEKKAKAEVNLTFDLDNGTGFETRGKKFSLKK